MNVPLPGVTVDPQGVSTSVAITDSHGNTPTVYSDHFGVNTVALPDTITARTTFFLPGEGPWTITPTASGQVTKATTLTLEDSQVATVTVGSVFDASQWEQFGAYVALVNTIEGWALNAGFYFTAAPTYNAQGTIASGNVQWPDGATGVYTVTSTDSNGAVTAYNVTYANASTGVNHTVTATIPRNSSSQVDAAMTVSVS